MRIIINGAGEAFFHVHKPIDLAGDDFDRLDEIAFRITLPYVHAEKFRENAELSMLLMMLYKPEHTASNEIGGDLYTVKKPGNISTVILAILHSNFFLNKENVGNYIELWNEYLLLNKETPLNIANNITIRWHMRLIQHMLANHDYFVTAGGQYIPKLGKTLSTHAAKLYNDIHLRLNDDKPITAEEFYSKFYACAVKDLKELTQPSNPAPPMFSLSHVANYTRADSTRQLYKDVLEVFEASKKALTEIVKKFDHPSSAAAGKDESNNAFNLNSAPQP